MACWPEAQALVVTRLGPLAPVKMETWPGAMLEISMGIMNGETRLGPDSTSLVWKTSMVSSPPSPTPSSTPTRWALASSMTRPECSTSILPEATANWTKRSMRLACLAGMYFSGSKPLTSPAMREVYSEASKWVMGPMPDFPATRFSQLVARSLPRGVMAARPVTTTRFPVIKISSWR